MNVQNFIPPIAKPNKRPRVFHKDKIYQGFFTLSTSQEKLREEARQRGEPVWRFEGAKKIMEYFFDIDLSLLQASVATTDMHRALADAESYVEINRDKSYAAFDKHGEPLVVMYHNAFQRIWGSTEGDDVVTSTTENITKLSRYVLPSKPKDARRHGLFEEWKREPENQQFSWMSGPNARSGIYYFGLWKESGHQHSPTILTSAMTSQGEYRNTIIRDFQLWCSNISQTIEVCFAGIDQPLRDEYRQKFLQIRQEGNREAISAREDELFPFQALLINLLTEPHRDHKDWKGGWTWLTPFGSYEDGLFCLSLLRRKFHFQPGSIVGIRGDKMEHFTTKWRGECRYSWVFAFQESIRVFG
jgi:hypothetical protein